ncbi:MULTISPECIES: MFS transporter [Streptomyces]|uniref:Arabinose ABC transporter permease n=1 Tax=Streptomyces viridochromogenes TaxID=1938 RepID=A0A0L8JJZ8_STRVR|nr:MULTISPECIES: MFS transporter [Streptomyces]KOG13987.1 arabinose ABC transporter permease [Streptomyces viridochromogenes]
MTSAGTATGAPAGIGGGPARGLTALLTTAMAFSMMQLFLLGALGPRLVDRLGVSESVLGLTTTVGFGTAAVLSPVGGRLVDRVGPRRALVALLALSAVALGLIGAAPGSGLLLVAVALGGLPQALANPATNKAILASVPASRRGAVTGTKQSGVQLGAFVAGLPLAVAASAIGWRGAVWVAAGAALIAALWAWRGLPADAAPPPKRATSGPARSRPGGPVPWLAAFSLFLGAGIASVNTYLALFGSQCLGMGPTVAGALVAVLGVAGIAGRVGWSRAATPGRAPWMPGLLAGGAVGAAVLLAIAVHVGPLVWTAAVAVGVFAVSGNAVSMVLVMQRSAPGRAGQDSALVAAGFFAGFAVGPPLFGFLAERGRYGEGWVLVAVEFAVAAAVALAWAVRDRRTCADGSR